MNKNTKRKGFTIVELIIVIAVIVVLAAVLIPTFVSITKKANQSADIQAVRQMNTALVTASVDGEIKTIENAAKALMDAGYNKELKPVSKDHGFYWYPKYNTIILINGENELVYPTNNKEIVDNYESDLAHCYNLELGHVKLDVTDASSLKEALTEGSNVTLTEDIELTTLVTSGDAYQEVGRPYGLMVAEEDVVMMDLGGKAIESSDASVAIVVEGELVLKNGSVVSRGITVLPGGKLTIEEGVTITVNADDGGACIRNLGGIVVINGGTFNALNGDETEDIVYEPGCIYNIGKLIINGGTFNSESSCYAIISEGQSIEINAATVIASRGAVAIGGGKAVINGGTFTSAGANSGHALYFAGSEHSTLVINGGTYNGSIDAIGKTGVTDNR